MCEDFEQASAGMLCNFCVKAVIAGKVGEAEGPRAVQSVSESQSVTEFGESCCRGGRGDGGMLEDFLRRPRQFGSIFFEIGDQRFVGRVLFAGVAGVLDRASPRERRRDRSERAVVASRKSSGD